MDESKETTQEETIFNASDFSLKRYDKHIRNARTTLYVVSALSLVAGIYFTLSGSRDNILDIWIEVVVMGGTFLVLGMWSNVKPFTALTVGLIVYILYHLAAMVIYPAGIFKGVLIKIIVVVYLIRGMNNAREAEEWKKTLKK